MFGDGEPNPALLTEIEDLIRSMPPRERLSHQDTEVFDWLGRAAAAVNRWDGVKGAMLKPSLMKLTSGYIVHSDEGYRDVMITLTQARHDLRMRNSGPTGVVLPQGGVFDYFDELRKAIELATSDVLFVDPYLDAEFVSRYLPHVRKDAKVRLLTSDKRVTVLLPAVAMFCQQHSHAVEVRTSDGLHDRYLFIDHRSCYQSGASFKDGARNAPTTLTQIIDPFDAVWAVYDAKWNAAKLAALAAPTPQTSA